jgi:hypothetical protein
MDGGGRAKPRPGAEKQDVFTRKGNLLPLDIEALPAGIIEEVCFEKDSAVY